HVALSADGRTALSSSWDFTLKLWDLASAEEIRTFTGHTGVALCAALAPDGRFAVSGSGDHTLRLWDFARGMAQRELEPRVVAAVPDRHFAWYYRGCLLAYLGDVDAYRKHCNAMLEKFGNREAAEVADRTAKTCLLLSEGGDSKRLLAEADRALGKATNDELR